MGETNIELDVRDARVAYESPKISDLGNATETMIETVRRVSLEGATAQRMTAGL